MVKVKEYTPLLDNNEVTKILNKFHISNIDENIYRYMTYNENFCVCLMKFNINRDMFLNYVKHLVTCIDKIIYINVNVIIVLFANKNSQQVFKLINQLEHLSTDVIESVILNYNLHETEEIIRLINSKTVYFEDKSRDCIII